MPLTYVEVRLAVEGAAEFEAALAQVQATLERIPYFRATDPALVPDDELDPTAEDGEPEAPDVATDPAEDDPDWDHQPYAED